MPTTAALAKPVVIDLALQGGGSHGAFTWGVLDRLLDDETINFDGISGTSAGALNAAVLATGLAEGGHSGAKAALHAFWDEVSGSKRCFGCAVPELPAAFNPWAVPMAWWAQQWLHVFSPYQFGTQGADALRRIVQRHVRPQAIRAGAVKLFVIATAVQTGEPRVFSRRELGREDLCVDALLASACLPQLFRAVQIEGQPYWDGGYSGNPALWPLIYRTDALDLLLVKINPLVRAELPDNATEIAERVNEITFNAGLVSEMRAIAFVQKLLAKGDVAAGEYRDLRLHMVADEQALAAKGAASKLRTDSAFLHELHGLGWQAADRWLKRHRQHLGVKATLDPKHSFLAPRTV